MLNELLKKVSPEVFTAVTDKFGLNQEMGAKAVDTTQESLRQSLDKEIHNGNVDGLLGLLKGGGDANESSTFKNMASQLSGDYIQKLGITPDLSSQISTYVLPLVFSKASSLMGGNMDKEGLIKMLGSDKGGIIGKAGDLLKDKLGNMFKK